MSHVTHTKSQDQGDQQSQITNQQSDIHCPFCDSAAVELFSLFGSQLLTTEYYCNNCRTVFENVKS
jgi:transposase-like protein